MSTALSDSYERLAGHADIRTTRRYHQVRQHRLEEGIERLSASRAALATPQT